MSQISRISPIGILVYNEKAQTSVDYLPIEAFACPPNQIKQQETYAGMKTYYT